jgi:hypothetical protein
MRSFADGLGDDISHLDSKALKNIKKLINYEKVEISKLLQGMVSSVQEAMELHEPNNLNESKTRIIKAIELEKSLKLDYKEELNILKDLIIYSREMDSIYPQLDGFFTSMTVFLIESCSTLMKYINMEVSKRFDSLLSV